MSGIFMINRPRGDLSAFFFSAGEVVTRVLGLL